MALSLLVLAIPTILIGANFAIIQDKHNSLQAKRLKKREVWGCKVQGGASAGTGVAVDGGRI